MIMLIKKLSEIGGEIMNKILNKKNIMITLDILLVLSGWVWAYCTYLNYEKGIKLRDQTIAQERDQKQQYIIELEESNQIITENADEIVNLKKEIEDLNHQLIQTESRYESLNTRFSITQEKLNDLVRYDCNYSHQDFSYNSNYAMNEELKLWVANRPSESGALYSKWNDYWNNSITAHHQFNGKYGWDFIVTFKKDTIQNENSVFFINEMCFLDR